MSARVFISRDAGALCVGADEVAPRSVQGRRQRGLAVEIVRTGSRGLYWLEPLVEVETPEGRVGYGPVTPADVDGLLDADARRRQASARPRPGRGHPLAQAPDAADLRPLRHRRSASLDDYRAHGGYKGLERALADRARGDRRGGGAFGPARPRRRRLPDRHQMADRRPDPAAAEIHRLQRRRGRQRHLRRPHDHGGRSLRPDRGHDHRRHRGRRDQGLRLYPLRISRMPSRRWRPRSATRARRRHPRRARRGLDLRLRHGGAGRRRRLCLRRGDLAAGKPRRQARRGPRQAAAAGAYRACSASRPSSTTSCRSPPCRSS